MNPYFANHARRVRFPWSLYHADLARRLAKIVASHGASPRVLIVGCGLEPFLEGGPEAAQYFGCDVDERCIVECKKLYPHVSDQLAVCPSGDELPSEGEFAKPFDLVIAKEVVEHILQPTRWATMLSRRLRVGGELVLTTPNYGRWSTLPLLESTVLELFARRDGYSRRHIHPTRFDRKSLAALDVGPDMSLVEVQTIWSRWALVGRFRRLPR